MNLPPSKYRNDYHGAELCRRCSFLIDRCQCWTKRFPRRGSDFPPPPPPFDVNFTTTLTR